MLENIILAWVFGSSLIPDIDQDKADKSTRTLLHYDSLYISIMLDLTKAHIHTFRIRTTKIFPSYWVEIHFFELCS
jgi:hypothetical protein